MSLRVIAGSARGTKLASFEGMAVRPTHDRVKEAVFSMLTGRITGRTVLDLFAGTGALGIEALSRGAEQAVFVDVSSRSLQIVSDNLKKTHLEERARLAQKDYLAYLSQTSQQFDLIFLDPPYKEGYLLPALELIRHRGLLTSDGLIYCEMGTEPPLQLADLFQVVRDKKYGRARILLLKEL